MNQFSLKSTITALVMLAAVTLGCGTASAFTAETYAASSRLASGHWVKIKTTQSGMHMIPASTLQRWGFSDPQRVRVYGYGGQQISDVLSAENYVDDLPMTMCEWTPQGLVFYAHGPMTWTSNSQGRWTYKPNFYSTGAYYFLGEATDDDLARETRRTGSAGATDGAATTFTDVAWHEVETVSPGSTGHVMLGEDFAVTKTRTFNFILPDRADDRLWVQAAFALKIDDKSPSSLRIAANGAELQGATAIKGENVEGGHLHYEMNNVECSGTAAGQQVAVRLTFSTAAPQLRLAKLDKITVNYSRRLALTADQLEFRLRGAASLQGATADTRVWDVTSPTVVSVVNTSVDGGVALWTPTEGGARQYVAWRPSSSLPVPIGVEVIANQNIHAMEVPDMVIFTLSQYRQQAERLADLHRNDAENPMTVAVILQDEAFNEFSSGTPDFGAMRRCLKMLFDRGLPAPEIIDGVEQPVRESKLRYCLMLGRSIYDHRGLTPETARLAGNLLFQWQTETGGDSGLSYTSEDFLSFMLDGSGASPGTDYNCLAVGRIPVKNESEARGAVDKIAAYMADDDKNEWKNRVVLATDDGNANVHIDQMEKAYALMTSTGGGQQYLYHKVYVDAFNVINRTAVDAHDRLERLLRQGVAWLWYIGHASVTSWSSEGLLTLKDINSARYNHSPMLFAATCDFLRWDDLEESGAETLFFNPNGIIGAIAASRPVYITQNEHMALNMAQSMADNADAGGTLTIGDMMRRAKNRMLTGGDTNKMRYVLMGDPAMRISFPRYRAVIDKINGVEPGAEEPPVIMASQQATVEGRLVDTEGNTVTDFQGDVMPTLYDAEYSTTSQGHLSPTEKNPVSVPKVFEEMGERLYIGRDKVTDGEFRLTMSMPADIASNYRPATLNIYALADDKSHDAIGVTRNFYVYGYDDSANSDDTPPVIESFGLNSATFSSGDRVDNSPMVIARMSDDTGINISGAGVGHQISLLLDGKTSYADAYLYYTPGEDGALSGSLYYRINDLAEGDHTLRLRVWDIANNMTEETIDFTVVNGLRPSIIDLYADCNPAHDHTNFYVRHNRPDAVMRVDVQVYDLLGRLVWTGSQSGTSTLDTTLPLQWDLTGRSGHRVPRGIYVYRASVATEEGEYVSAARKIAVTAP